VPATLKEPKSQRFVARVTVADKQLFRKAAAIEGRSLAKFITIHTREAARQIVNQSNLIQLDGAQSRRFVEALLAPPRPPTAALKRAMARYRRDVTSIWRLHRMPPCCKNAAVPAMGSINRPPAAPTVRNPYCL
jgi:uncharacterized protein (DUF1778 family)